MRRALSFLALAALVSACPKKTAPPKDEEGLYTSRGFKFKHGELPEGWTRAAVDGTALAFDHKKLGATITAFSNCKNVEDISLRALVQQELVGIEKKEVVEKSETPMGDRDAADWVVKGSLDGVEVQMELVVLRTGKCVYDMVLVTSAESFAAARPDFKTFVGGFEVIP